MRIELKDKFQFPRLNPFNNGRAVATLTSAFITDPVIRWMYPTASEYLTCFPAFMQAFGGEAFVNGTVAATPDLSAVALWIGPGKSPDSQAIEACLMSTVAEDQHEDLFSVFEVMDDHHPTERHWYLPWFGVDSFHQNEGRGGQLMRKCLQQVDADRLPAYLESPNPRNVSFYERYGFAVTGAVRKGACPPVTFMYRPAIADGMRLSEST